MVKMLSRAPTIEGGDAYEYHPFRYDAAFRGCIFQPVLDSFIDSNLAQIEFGGGLLLGVMIESAFKRIADKAPLVLSTGESPETWAKYQAELFDAYISFRQAGSKTLALTDALARQFISTDTGASYLSLIRPPAGCWYLRFGANECLRFDERRIIDGAYISVPADQRLRSEVLAFVTVTTRAVDESCINAAAEDLARALTIEPHLDLMLSRASDPDDPDPDPDYTVAESTLDALSRGYANPHPPETTFRWLANIPAIVNITVHTLTRLQQGQMPDAYAFADWAPNALRHRVLAARTAKTLSTLSLRAAEREQAPFVQVLKYFTRPPRV